MPKQRRDREYTAEERALYAVYRDRREAVRPRECHGGGEDCWVEQGPPCWSVTSSGFCTGCGGSVLLGWSKPGRYA